MLYLLQGQTNKYYLKYLKNRKLYHGSYTIVKYPDLMHSQSKKDFGKGFYVTTDMKQAMNFARQMAIRYNSACGYLNIYQFSNFDDLDTFEFLNADRDWLNCIIGFRDRHFIRLAKPYMNYEVLMGKIADDNTSSVLNAYMAGAYGMVGTPQAESIAINLLLPNRLKNQICFKSERSLERLEFIKEDSVWL